MKAGLASLLLAALLVAGVEARAAGGYPQSADRLEEYRACLAQTPGGAVLRGSALLLDQDHLELLAAMERNPGVPPQVIPPGAVVAPFGLVNAYNFALWGATGYAAVHHSVNTASPAFWWYMGTPLIYTW